MAPYDNALLDTLATKLQKLITPPCGAVQMGKRTELDRLWKWTKMYMRNKAGDHKGRRSSSMPLENAIFEAG
jgi:hypothetical protein